MKILNNYTKKYIAILTIFMVFASCSDYLSELPDNRTEIDSPEKIGALITGAYPQGNYMLMAELMSDNALSKGTNNGVVYPDLFEEMFNWEISNSENQDSPQYYWSNCYEAISQANQALASIKKFEGDYNLSAQKGEALLTRAYNHFMLVNFWGKHYNATSASTDQGVPYVTETETVLLKKYKRNTVQEVYDLIEKDLLKGIELVEKRNKNPKFHFSKEAGHAFATRFYTFKGEWDKVIEHASKILTDPRNQIRNEVEYSTLSYDQQTFRYNGALERANLLINSTNSLWARSYASTNYGLPSGSSIFSSNNPFNKSWAYGIYGGNRFANRPKFDEYFKITNQSAGTGQPFTPTVLFSNDEVLLNRAEAYAMIEDYTNSLKDLTDFLSQKTNGFNDTDNLTEQMLSDTFSRINIDLTPSYTINSKQTLFLKAILDFRQKEFYHEGMRWFDVRRFEIKIVRDFIKGDTSKKITLEKDDNRKQLQIPQIALKFGMTPNPR